VVGTVVDPSSSASNLWWARIETAYGTGWVAEAFLASAASSGQGSRSFSIGERVVVNDGDVRLRSSAGTSGTIVRVLVNGDTGSVTAGPSTANGYVWYKVDTSGTSGWVASNYLARASSSSSGARIWVGDLVTVDTDGIKLRERAGLNGKWVATLYSGESALVIGGSTVSDGYTWVKLRAGSGEGWGVASYLARDGKASIRAGHTARVIEGELNLRSSAGTGASVVAVLPDGAHVSVLESPKSANGLEWVRVSSSRYGTGWCATKYLIRA
ncbi:MAG TPA: SH3 domain-containing protein, partial [Thermomicrobiales bacterium]|nr:SH3 domain-containing protein [Thermomicrobiales bacterium]